MTQPESPAKHPASDSDSAPAVGAGESPPETPRPEPEPWTPERATEWNDYYDLYVTLGVLLLTFLASANLIGNSTIWNQLQVGRVIAANASPLLKDPFSYTEAGKPWVNIPWLFEWSHALIHKTAYDMTPGDTTDRTAWAARADQVAAGTLVALNALARMLTALLLLGIRRTGPGRWWSAACVVLALGAVFGPGAVMIGGIAGPPTVGPATWGILLLALEVWLIHKAVDRSSRGAALALVPLFVLWANVDESFLIGLFLLAACVVGRFRHEHGKGPIGFEPPLALTVLAASIAACLVNPSVFHVFRAAGEPFLALFRPATDVLTPDQLSYFGRGIRERSQGGNIAILMPGVGVKVWQLLVAFYLFFVTIGFGSFYLNRRRFSLSRFLMYTVAVLLWGVLKRYSAEFAIVFAATLAMNGQEWYQHRFGTAGRIGTGWSLWSVGGRAATILVLFLCIAKVLLGGLPVPGFAPVEGDGQFGFGYDRDEFAFEAADFLKGASFHGNVLNTTKAEGDALIWRAYPERKTYIDNREHLFPPEVFTRLQETRRALSTDDAKTWKPLLDRYEITAVMVPPATAPVTYRVLSLSENWVPFYDDGAVVLFGRTDASADDVKFFNANRLDPEALAYKREKPTPSSDRPPTPVGWMDNVFQARARARQQPHDEAASHWLTIPNLGATGPALPDPARCLLAIREARTALASKPDDNMAFRILAVAYRALMIQETALGTGLELTPENAANVAQTNPRPDLLTTRFRELVTALNYAIQTTPPPKTPEARHELRRLNVELYRLLLSANFLDLARDRLQAVLDKSVLDDYFTRDDRVQISKDLAELTKQVQQVQDEMTNLMSEQQVSPVDLAGFAMNQGAPGLAIHELEEAERTGTNPALVKPRLLDLYCATGQPEKAEEMLAGGTVEDPSFGTEPGVSAMRQGRVYFLRGNYEHSGTLWGKTAIQRLRLDRSMRALGSTQSFLHGDVRNATGSYLEIPGRITQQGDWEFEAGLCRLEGGVPALAAEHFTNALVLSPKINTRPIIAYYLEKLGKPVPPAPETAKDKEADAKPKTEEKDKKDEKGK